MCAGLAFQLHKLALLVTVLLNILLSRLEDHLALCLGSLFITMNGPIPVNTNTYCNILLQLGGAGSLELLHSLALLENGLWYCGKATTTT